MSVRIIKIIAANNATIGLGVVGDPVRRVLQLYTIEGSLILEIDPGKDGGAPCIRHYDPRVATDLTHGS